MSRLRRHPDTGRSPTRLLALPWVLVCVLVYVGSVLHFALVQHTTCLEHGDVMHVGEAQVHGSPSDEEASFDDARVARVPRAQAVPHSAEAHCHHAFFRREALPPAESAPMMDAVSTRSSPALAVFRFHAAPVALLRLAPKLSPPRA
ncbi:hypothetical protein [Corallococcus llansteffanensis]|uniref:Uncharacterized protein n=1 Tax=Corallococcus llansteffanensis TaxID=2316731 RepID=A0A3A8PDP0_9BACT|nr:hypothetical protein [Corallococcus llansteffanensis]RKH50602.1 hypothetical protein D7V93_30285 [Corallococcus llansteffanensis]